MNAVNNIYLSLTKSIALDRMHRKLAAAEALPFSIHLREWVDELTAKAKPKHVRQFRVAVDRILGGLNGIAAIDPAGVVSRLRLFRGASAKNRALLACKSFTRWLVKQGRLPCDPLACLTPVNPRQPAHPRRALTEAEARKLVETARLSGKFHGGLSGQTRALLYETALTTGLRAGELLRLTPAHFDFTSKPSVVRLAAHETKNGRPCVIPLRDDIAACLERRAALVIATSSMSHKDRDLMFPLNSRKTAALLRLDLADAGIPYYDAAAGGYADFHSLRHTFCTRLARAGVNLKTMQHLARHADARLTINRYSHLDTSEAAAALESLPSLVA